MINFVREKFRVFFIIGLWLWLLFCVIGGGILGYQIDFGLGAFIGVIIGVLVGIFCIVLGGGLIATFLNIDENLEILIKYSKNEISEGNRVNCPFCAEKIKREAIVCPFCGKNIKEYELELKTKVGENIKNMEEGSKIILEVIENIPLRKAANETSGFDRELNKGEQVFAINLQTQFNYLNVTTQDGKKGWVLEKYLKQI
jgi:endogenous inhibitor of DNA gyrase (YacG/DUF329 family)